MLVINKKKNHKLLFYLQNTNIYHQHTSLLQSIIVLSLNPSIKAIRIIVSCPLQCPIIIFPFNENFLIELDIFPRENIL